MRVLIFGFSVTADKNGYSEVLKRQLPGLTVIGIGGINPLPLPGIFDAITAEHGVFDYVLLEISTSIFSSTTTEEESSVLLQDIIHRIQSTGASVAFVSMYRDDFDYGTQRFDPLIRSMCAESGLPLLDIGPSLLTERGRDFCRSLLRDAVHTNHDGAAFQAMHIAKFIQEIKTTKNKATVPPPRARRYQIPLGTEIFSRTGWTCSYLPVQEGGRVAIEIPKTSTVYGVSYITDPDSGYVRVSAERETTINFLYEHSYYQHYCFRRINLRGSVTIEQLPGIPSVKLLKGETSKAPRVAKLAALHLIDWFQ